jgi:hypothetical protein
MVTYLENALVNFLSTTCTFDLWMSKEVHDVFLVITIILSCNSKIKHVIIGLTEVTNTIGTMKRLLIM